MSTQIPVAPRQSKTPPPRWRHIGLVGIKTVHTLAFFGIGSCLCYFAYTAVMRRSDRQAAMAGAVVTVEALIYAANGLRCPLTDAAERLGSQHGSVADIYLPRWLEEHLPFITGPVFAAAVGLHASNLIQTRRSRRAGGPTGFAGARRSLRRGDPIMHHAQLRTIKKLAEQTPTPRRRQKP